MTTGRALVAPPLLLVVARLRAPLGRPLVPRDYIAFVVLGLTTIWYWGLASTTALNAGILGAASPIFVAVTAALVLGDRLTPANWVGIGLSVVAVLTTVAKGSLAVLLTFTVNRGDLIILLSQAAWVSDSLYGRAAASTLPPVWIMAGAHVVSGLVLVPVAVLFGDLHEPDAVRGDRALVGDRRRGGPRLPPGRRRPA
ncbi:MAG: DMT family transporter [Candidatus Rokubacteria bacterium]|nr:DMT family transporter [Candidatus Rokubacteria bacterium]